jgi:hypothetical protein
MPKESKKEKSGWIKIHRSLQDHWLWQNPERLRCWLDLLLLANHERKKFFINETLVVCERGQTALSMKTLSERWRRSRHWTRSLLLLLQNDTMITFKSNAKTTLITICNYGNYQNVGTSEGQQKDISGTSEGHQRDTNTNYKELKEEGTRKKFTPPTIDMVHAEFISRGLSPIVATAEAETFLNHYSACGWVVGKNKPMKDWKACVGSWISRMSKYHKSTFSAPVIKPPAQVNSTDPETGYSNPFIPYGN